MIQLDAEIDFDIEELRPFVETACAEIVKQQMAKDMAPLQRPKIKLDFSHFVIIHNLPQINEEKKPKLQAALKTIMGKKVPAEDIKNFEINLTGQGLVEFKDEDKAILGASLLDNFMLDKTHFLRFFPLKQLNEILRTPATYHPLVLRPKKDLEIWLADPQIRNQVLLVQERQKFTLQWFQHLEGKFEPILTEVPLAGMENIEWSRRGTYLVIYTSEGFELWGGNKPFARLHKFSHPGVKSVIFSPDDKYVISFSGPEGEYCIWYVRMEQKLKTFDADQLDNEETLQFNSNGTWLSRIEKNALSIYEVPSFQLFKKIDISNIQNYTWIERTNFICYSAFNGTQRDADRSSTKNQIQFIEIEKSERNRELKWRQNQFETDWIQLFSHERGRWVVAVITKKIKKRVVATIVQLANFKKIDHGIDVITEEFNEEVEQVFFEPRTGKIAIRYKDPLSEKRAVKAFHFKFYAVDEGKNLDLKEIGHYPNKDTNEVLWSPNGTYFAYVNTTKGSPDQGKLEFGMVLRKVSPNQTVSYALETTKSTNHYYMSYAAWDPSGAYFITFSEQWSSVILWSAIGEQLIKDTITKITHINWRRQPTHAIEDADERKLVSEKDTFIKKYEQEDNRIINRAEIEKQERRQKLHDDFVAILAAKKKRWQQHRQQRKELLGFDADDKSILVEDEIVEREELVEQQKQQ